MTKEQNMLSVLQDCPSQPNHWQWLQMWSAHDALNPAEKAATGYLNEINEVNSVFFINKNRTIYNNRNVLKALNIMHHHFIFYIKSII